MKLSKKNWLGRYYNWVKGYYPEDLCSFFWGSILIILLTPFFIASKSLFTLSDYDKNDYIGQSFVGIVLYVLYGTISLMGSIVLGWFGYEYTHLIWSLTLGFLLGVSFLASCVGIGVLIRWSFFKVWKSNFNRDFFDKDLLGAIRGKYCTKITWK